MAGGSVRVQMHAGSCVPRCPSTALASSATVDARCAPHARTVARPAARDLLLFAERIDFMCARLAPCRRLSSRCRLANAERSPAAPRPTARCAPPCEREGSRSAARVLCSRRAQSARRRVACPGKREKAFLHTSLVRSRSPSSAGRTSPVSRPTSLRAQPCARAPSAHVVVMNVASSLSL